jgi:cytochrome c oxidase subunit 5a
VNDYPTAVRIFEGKLSLGAFDSRSWMESGLTKLNLGIKHKVENQSQYEEYLKELEPIREELGISLQEHMYPGL